MRGWIELMAPLIFISFIAIDGFYNKKIEDSNIIELKAKGLKHLKAIYYVIFITSWLIADNRMISYHETPISLFLVVLWACLILGYIQDTFICPQCGIISNKKRGLFFKRKNSKFCAECGGALNQN